MAHNYVDQIKAIAIDSILSHKHVPCTIAVLYPPKMSQRAHKAAKIDVLKRKLLPVFGRANMYAWGSRFLTLLPSD